MELNEILKSDINAYKTYILNYRKTLEDEGIILLFIATISVYGISEELHNVRVIILICIFLLFISRVLNKYKGQGTFPQVKENLQKRINTEPKDVQKYYQLELDNIEDDHMKWYKVINYGSVFLISMMFYAYTLLLILFNYSIF